MTKKRRRRSLEDVLDSFGEKLGRENRRLYGNAFITTRIEDPGEIVSPGDPEVMDEMKRQVLDRRQFGNRASKGGRNG